MTNSNPGLVNGQVPQASDWNSFYAAKVDEVSGNLVAPNITGNATQPSAPTLDAHLANKAYVDAVHNTVSPAFSGLTAKGVWNASTNTPTLTSSVGTQGDIWIVATAGTTTLNGNSTWAVGDQVVFSVGAWVRAPFSTTFGTMSVQNATNVAVTGGTAANLSTLGLQGGATLVPVSGVPDDAYLSDADGGLLALYSNSLGAWVFLSPVSGAAGSFTSLNTGLLSLAQIALASSGSPDTNIFATTVSGSPFPLALLDPDGGVMNNVDPATGKWVKGSADPVIVPAALVNAGRYRTRLTCKPITFGWSTPVNSTTGTTYAAIFTTEGMGSLWRFLIPSALSTATIKVAFAFSDTVNDGINPLIGGKASPWTTVTWINGGADVDWITQRNALNAASMAAPTTFTLPAAAAGNVSGLPIFKNYLSDWMALTSVARTDGGSGACLVFVRVEGITGTLQLAAAPADASGSWDASWHGRTVRSYSQAVLGVTTPSSFTSTTRAGLYACSGVQYECRDRGIQFMTGGDSTTAGTGSGGNVDGAWRQVAVALSTVNTPVELFVSAQPASDEYTFTLQFGNDVDFVKPTVAYLQAWSRNSWKDTQLVPGSPAFNGHPDTQQTRMSGTITAGNVVTQTITDANVTGSPVAVSYTVQGGDTLASVAAGLAAAIQGTSALFTAGYRAFSTGNWCVTVFTSPLPSSVATTVNGGATLTVSDNFDALYIPQGASDLTYASSLSVADRVEGYGGVYVVATLPGDIGMTLLTDIGRTDINTKIRAMTNRVVIDYDAVLSGSTGPFGAPQIPSPSLSADGVHPNAAGYTIEVGLLKPAIKAVYGLS